MSDQHYEYLLLGFADDSATAKLPQIGGLVGLICFCALTKFYNFLLSVKIIPNNLKCLGCEQDFDASALDADVSNSLCNLCHAAFCGDDGFSLHSSSWYQHPSWLSLLNTALQ